MVDIMAKQEKDNWQVDQDFPIGPQLYRILRERIIRNDLPPGTRISEAEIALSYSVSRQPVREAFILLSKNGLLEVRPQRGSLVSKISPNEVKDARFVREAIEADIVKILAKKGDKKLVKELYRQLKAQYRVSHDNLVLFMKLDEKFHRTLAEAAGKTHAWGVVENTRSQMDRVRFLSLVQFPFEKVILQHNAIIEAIEATDIVLAEKNIRIHLQEILKDLPDVINEHPSSFVPTE